MRLQMTAETRRDSTDATWRGSSLQTQVGATEKKLRSILQRIYACFVCIAIV